MNQYISSITLTPWGGVGSFDTVVSLDLDTVSFEDGGGHATVNGVSVSVPPRGVCQHGVFVAGGGRDIPCGPCEMGEEPWTAADLLGSLRRYEARIQGFLDACEEYGVSVSTVGSIVFPSTRNRYENPYAWLKAVIRELKAAGGWDAWRDDDRTATPNADLLTSIERAHGVVAQLERAAAVSADPTVDFESVLYCAAERAISDAVDAGLVTEAPQNPNYGGSDCSRCGGYGIIPQGQCAECDGTGVGDYRYNY